MSLRGWSGSATVVLQAVPEAQSPIWIPSQAPKQNPSVGAKPTAGARPRLYCSSVAAVMQRPLLQSVPCAHRAPAVPVPITGAQAATQADPEWVGCGWQLRPAPPTGQPASSTQVGWQEATVPRAMSPNESVAEKETSRQ